MNNDYCCHHSDDNKYFLHVIEKCGKCGGEGRQIKKVFHNGHIGWMVKCKNCGHSGSAYDTMGKSSPEALKDVVTYAWNTKDENKEFEILKCVICGADPEVREERSESNLTMYVKCSECDNKSVSRTIPANREYDEREFARRIILTNWNCLNKMRPKKE